MGPGITALFGVRAEGECGQEEIGPGPDFMGRFGSLGQGVRSGGARRLGGAKRH
jgi:hypothetical protein